MAQHEGPGPLPSAQVVPEALQHLEEQGFEIEICDPVWLAKAHRDGYYVDLITGMSNAVITVDQSWIDREPESMVLGVRARVLAAEELIASKLFVNFRERFDGADIVHIIYGTQGRLDWTRLRQLAGDHWELLLWELVLFHYVYPIQATLCSARCLERPARTSAISARLAFAAARIPRQLDRRKNVCHRCAGVGTGKPAGRKAQVARTENR